MVQDMVLEELDEDLFPLRGGETPPPLRGISSPR